MLFRSMRFYNLLAVSSLVFFTIACGSKDSNSIDYYQSCALPSASQSVDLSACLESKNSTDLKPSCESTENGKLAGAYAQTQCNVTTGTKGCSYKNAQGVELIQWYSGSGWTVDLLTSNCTTSVTGGTVVTK